MCVLLPQQIQSICQSGETRLKSEKTRIFITTPSASVSFDDDEYGELVEFCTVYDVAIHHYSPCRTCPDEDSLHSVAVNFFAV